MKRISGILCYILLSLLLTAVAHVTQDFCIEKSASLKCPDSHIIKVTSARYGRMKATSHCISQTYKTGCHDDVTDRVQGRCWGRRNCSFEVRSFVDLTPCPDLSSYLEVQYTCAPAIELGRCGSKLQLTSDKGYLSLPTYTPASRQCTWTLLVNKTQHLSITVEPISNNASLLCTSSVQVNELQQMGRQTYGWHSITACPDGDSHYQSKSPGVRLDLSKSHHTRQEPLFLLRYRVYGCPEIGAPLGGWAKQNSSFAMVKCNLTAETWYLSCTGTEWNGSAGNCNVNTDLHTDPENGQDTFPLSIVMAIFLGLLLGIVVGVILLGLVYFYFWYRKKPKSHYQTPDIAGSYYGEDPSHKEMYGTSLERQHTCDYSTNYPSTHSTCPAHFRSELYGGKYTGIISADVPQCDHTTLPHPDDMYPKRLHSDNVNT